MSAPKIALVCDTQVQQHYLKQTVEQSACQVIQSVLVKDLLRKGLAKKSSIEPERQLSSTSMMDIDAWIVVVDVEQLEKNDGDDVFQRWLDAIEQPVIFSESGAYNGAADTQFISWQRQLTKKLLAIKGQLSLCQKNVNKASCVWVLAASTGGPEAVKRFLDALDMDADVGFIYAQHIDQRQSKVLRETITRDNRYRSFVAAHGDIIGQGDVAIVPVEHSMELQDNGTIACHQGCPWRGIYQPSIDQIVANVASVYQQHAGVIFFTGMGEDGVAGGRLMSLHGGRVWAQVVSSCVASSMPQAVIDTGYVNKIDSPEHLALHFKKMINN